MQGPYHQFDCQIIFIGNRSETFEADIAVVKVVSDLEGAMKLWRKQGAIGKPHNLIRFIRASPQCEGYLWIW